MSRPMKIMLISVSIVFGIIFGIYFGKKAVFYFIMSHYVPPAVTISSSTAKLKNWQSYVISVGNLTAVNGIDISSEVPGIVKNIYFQSGQFVKKGDLLFMLDTSVETAQLKDNLAQANLAKLDYDRNRELIKKHAVSQSQLDTLAAKLNETLAGVEQIQAKIQQKTIRAQFDGKIGIRLVDPGQYVSAGTPMVTLQALNPLYVQFNIPEQYLPELYLQQPVEININLIGGKSLNGTISAINSKVDQTTHNILVQAIIPNNNLQLYPGMFASVKVLLREHKNVVTLPQTAISYSLHGDSVYIIKKEKTENSKEPILNAYRQYVKVGERRDDEASILEGIKPGDQVVTSGQLKLQNGTHIVIDNSVEL